MQRSARDEIAPFREVRCELGRPEAVRHEQLSLAASSSKWARDRRLAFVDEGVAGEHWLQVVQ
ncbi:hypothetical protein [Kribbella swartbergensis]